MAKKKRKYTRRVVRTKLPTATWRLLNMPTGIAPADPATFTGLEPHITETRNTTHGSFAENARISQGIKLYFVGKELSLVHREALDMIALKISRILSGKANVKDHWLDIQGYAKLAEDACD